MNVCYLSLFTKPRKGSINLLCHPSKYSKFINRPPKIATTHSLPTFLYLLSNVINVVLEFYDCTSIWSSRLYFINYSISMLMRHHVDLIDLIIYVMWINY